MGKISQMPLATSVSGQELIEVVQGGVNKKLPISNIVAAGKSAYQSAVSLGYTGTEAQWINSLRGPVGPQGATGPAGVNGLSAYQLAVAGGYQGSHDQWLASLVGPQGIQGPTGQNGKSAYQLAVQNGYTGTEAQWLLTLKGETGPSGKSAYELAVDSGFSGSQSQWLASLVGPQGAAGIDGKSAYQIALDNGFVGTQQQWLASLVGSGTADSQVITTLQNQIATIQNFLNSVNRTPNATIDSATGSDDQIRIEGNVLSNDSDPDGNPLTITQFSYGGARYSAGDTANATYGSLYLDPTGYYAYTFNSAGTALSAGASVVETFSYNIMDSHGALATTTLTLTIIGTNNNPIVVADNAIMAKNKSASGNVLLNDFDPEHQTLSVVSVTVEGVGSTFTTPATISLAGHAVLDIAADGAWSVTPTTDYVGELPLITYRVSDGVNEVDGTLFLAVDLGPIAALSDPVTTAMTGRVEYDVYTEADLDAIPWSNLEYGTVVNVHYKPTPYRRKFGLRGKGTYTQPIVINGVTDSNGNRPELDFNNSFTCPSCLTGTGGNAVFGTTVEYNEGLGGIVIKRGTKDPESYKPEYIKIKNLTLRGATVGNTFTTAAGVVNGGAYGSAAGGLFVLLGKNITAENCIITDNSNGVFTMAKNDVLAQACEYVTLRNCRIYGNGNVGSWYEHNVYMQCKQPIVEGCYLGQVRPGSLGSTYKSRSSRDIIRFSTVEASARALDLVHSEDQDIDGIQKQPEYGVDLVYGCLILNDDLLTNGHAYAAIHYGGDNLGEDENSSVAGLTNKYRRELNFFNNTYLTRMPTGFRVCLFDISLKTINVNMWNNSFLVDAAPSAEVSWTEWAGNINLIGVNSIYSTNTLLPSRSDAVISLRQYNELGTIITGDPKPYDIVNYRFEPANTSSLAGTAAATPVGLNALVYDQILPVQTRGRTNGMMDRSTLVDIGAFELIASAQLSPTGFSPPVVDPGGGGGPSNVISPTGNIFLFEEPDHTLISSNASWQGGGVSSTSRYEVMAGALQCVTGTGGYGEIIYYSNSQTDDQACSMLIDAGWVGTIGMYINAGPNVGGYNVSISPTIYTYTRGGVWQANASISVPTTAPVRLILSKVGTTLTLTANGVQLFSIEDGTPITGGIPGFALMPGADVTKQRLLEWTDSVV